MSDLFDAFDNNTEANFFDSGADPAAAFLAKEEAELARIENNDFLGTNDADPFGDFGGSSSVTNDPFEIEAITKASSNLIIEDQPEQNDAYSAISSVDILTKEPEKIKRWREEQKLRLATKDAEEDQKKKEWKEGAKKELDDWYRNRSEQLAKTIANNKINNKAAEADLLAAREAQDSDKDLGWDRMAKLCDFNPKANKNTKDVSRMRSILLQLKQQPLVR